jgi:hypothetical protein
MEVAVTRWSGHKVFASRTGRFSYTGVRRGGRHFTCQGDISDGDSQQRPYGVLHAAGSGTQRVHSFTVHKHAHMSLSQPNPRWVLAQVWWVWPCNVVLLITRGPGRARSISNEPYLVAAINATLHPDLTLVVVCDPPGPVVGSGGRGFARASQPPNSVAALAFRARCVCLHGWLLPNTFTSSFFRKSWSMCACL